MKRELKISVAGGIALLILLCMVLFVRAPISALHAIERAARDRDLAELERRVDFPALKTSMKGLIMDTVEEAATKKGGGALASLSRVFTGALANTAIETMVKPESLALMFRGRLPGKSDADSPPQAQGLASEKVEISKTWDGLSTVRVRVHAAGDPAKGVNLVMRREGLSWRLVGVER